MIHELVSVPIPFAEALARFEDPHDWLAPLASRAYADGEEFCVRIGLGDSQPRLTKTVRLQVGVPRSQDDTVVVPLRWEATGAAMLFPIMDANLVLRSTGHASTEIALWGSYDPPMNALGRGLDRLGLYRVADASARSFLAQIARTLTGAHRDSRVSSA